MNTSCPPPITPPLGGPLLRAALPALAALHRASEPELLPGLLTQAQLTPAQSEATQALALKVARGVRERSRDSGRAGLVQGLLQEFALSSQEGVALMCLAEALLRIPDAATRDALIRDKLAHGNWAAHLGRSPSLFVNAAAWGLLLTGHLVATHSDTGLSQALRRLVGRGGEPLIRKGVDMAMRMMGEQFVTGQTIAQALHNAQAREQQGFGHSYDMLGEAALTQADALAYTAAYEAAIDAIGRASAGRGIYQGPGISIKLSALHPRYSRAQIGRVMEELYPRLRNLALLARHHDIGLNIDAEEADRLELSLALLERLCHDEALAGFNGIGFVIQAYQKRCPAVVDWLIALARHSRRRLMVRLVKGAYWDSEIKRAQLDGQAAYPVYTRKAYTDVAYLACARKLLAAPDAVFPQFATHNAHTVAAIHTLAGGHFYAGQYEFQCLHGMGEPLYEQVVGTVAAGKLARPCRIYAPVGSHDTLLAYLVRRLLENGANSSFVNRVADEAVSLHALCEDPVHTVQTWAEAEGVLGLPHPRIALPDDLFGRTKSVRGRSCTSDMGESRGQFGSTDQPMLGGMGAEGEPKMDRFLGHCSVQVSAAHAPRANSQGMDLASEATLQGLAQALAASKASPWHAQPMVASSVTPLAPLAITNPADPSDVVGHVREASPADVAAALAAAEQAAPLWAAQGPAERAAVLEHAADLMQARMASLCALLVREAGKTWANAVAEVREAVDFLRYNAQQVRSAFDNATHLPLGVVVCISPWNFPLAIFTGQVAAALAAGNVVLAKPAEQTPLIAAQAVALLHEAGVSPSAVQLLPGRGETVGAALVADARVCGVLFTGSTEVARLLQQALCGRLLRNGQPVPLVAETGGSNAMLVDTSALPEQVVADVLASAFDCAGQRCSALRVLCLQEEAAPKVVDMLHGALRELRLGNPAELATDVGPVIDEPAASGLLAHITAMRLRGHQVVQAHTAPEMGCFVPPTVIELNHLHELQGEVFGPVLHVLRYPREGLSELLSHINASGYGLTGGVHSRIDETVLQVASQLRCGNLYVNRNVVGAVVGVQPFGGEGLSGTGPKAGGPLYLLRLLAVAPADAARAAVEACGAPALPPLRGFEGAVLDAAAHDARHALLAHAPEAFNGLQSANPVGHWRQLPGPTGEANLYAVLPREQVLCLADNEPALLHQLAAVLSVGARALWPASQRPVLHNLPASVRERVSLAQDWAAPAVHFDAVLHSGPAEALRALLAALAQRPGPIVSATATRCGEPVPPQRLVIERSLSINTAAAGGNASLMMLG